jgi:hypothetical protein
MAGPSGFVVPFDAAGSLMVRFVTDLPDSSAIPFPNLRALEADELRFVSRWIEAGARDGDRVPFADATDLLFACVQGENHVDVLDSETMRIIRRVHFDDHGLASAPLGPHHVAFEPGGAAWYVSLISTGAVAKLSTSLTMDPSDPAYLLGTARMTTPGMLIVDPTSDRLYAGRSTLSDRDTEGFAVIDRSDMTLDEVDTPFAVPHALAVSPDGRFVLTASLTGNQVAVYDPTGELVDLEAVPGPPTQLIHFSFIGVHHAARPAPAGEMDHSAHGAPATGVDHAAMGHTTSGTDAARHDYEATLTAKDANEVLIYGLTTGGQLELRHRVPAGTGPWHAHTGHDGTTIIIPNRGNTAGGGNAVTLLDASTRQIIRTVSASAPAGPLAQPHSPAPDHAGERFFVTSSNTLIEGAWVAPYRFLGPPAADGARAPLPATSFSNVTAFAMDGTVLETVQLGAYASGLEPFTVGVGGHESQH